MIRMGTVATHNGSQVSQAHNRRDRRVTDKESHIDKDGEFEVWLDVDVKQAYKKIFAKSVEEYNKTQKRKDRQITDYYKKISADKKKHTCYEMVVGVYGEDSTDEQKREILKKFVETWKQRNGNNMFLIGAYLHNDEEGGMHVHCTYIPIYQSNKGMKLQNGLNKALEQLGIEEGESIHETRQINWQKRENAYLTQLCEERGIRIEHPMADGKGKRKHLSTEQYKIEKQKEDLLKGKSELELLQKGAKYDSLYGKAVAIQKERDELRKENVNLREKNNQLQSANAEMYKQMQKAEKERKKIADEYIKKYMFSGVEPTEDYKKKIIDDVLSK